MNRRNLTLSGIFGLIAIAGGISAANSINNYNELRKPHPRMQRKTFEEKIESGASGAGLSAAGGGSILALYYFSKRKEEDEKPEIPSYLF